MDKLGKILFPEQYAPVGKEVRLRNSVEALAFFEEFYGKNGIVILGNIRLQNKHLMVFDILIWLYVDISDDQAEIISSIPVFDIPIDELDNCKILEVIPHQNEVFSLWNDTLYSSVYTSKGEICIKKVRSLLDAEEAIQVIEMQSGKKVEDIYPVELYSHSKHKFIGVCWAVEMEDDFDRIYWHPVCLDEEKAIASYPAEDITDHFINVNETAVIGGNTFRLLCNGDDGYFFKKVPDEQVAQKTFVEQVKAQMQFFQYHAEHPATEDASHKGKLIQMSFPQKHQSKN